MTEMEAARTTETIAAEINMIKAQARDIYVRSAIEIGRRLFEAKTMVPYGKWGEWLEKNVDYSVRTAQNLIAVYEEYGRRGDAQAIAGLSFTQAVLLLGLDREARAELMEREDVPEMSTRELKAEIERIHAEMDRRQMTIDALLAEKAGAEAEMEAERSAMAEERGSLEARRAQLAGAEADAERARAQAQDAVKRANETAAENLRLKAELQAERDRPAPPPEVVQVETVPPEVAEELEAMRRRAERNDGAVMLLRDAYDRLVAQFGEVERRIDALAERAPEEAAKYRAAVGRAAAKMAERLDRHG